MDTDRPTDAPLDGGAADAADAADELRVDARGDSRNCGDCGSYFEADEPTSLIVGNDGSDEEVWEVCTSCADDYDWPDKPETPERKGNAAPQRPRPPTWTPQTSGTITWGGAFTTSTFGNTW